jgi:antitoxin MazE
MQVRVQKWGNDLAIRIPPSFVSEIGIEQDSLVEITLVDETLVIMPVPAQENTLEDLLEQITEENIHREQDMGPPTGQEIW